MKTSLTIKLLPLFFLFVSFLHYLCIFDDLDGYDIYLDPNKIATLKKINGKSLKYDALENILPEIIGNQESVEIIPIPKKIEEKGMKISSEKFEPVDKRLNILISDIHMREFFSIDNESTTYPNCKMRIFPYRYKISWKIFNFKFGSKVKWAKGNIYKILATGLHKGTAIERYNLYYVICNLH